MPAQDRVGRDDRRDLVENTTTEDLAPRRKPAALVVGPSKASIVELLLEPAVLFDEILDGRGLVAIDPGGEGCQESLGERNSVIAPASYPWSARS